MAEVRAPAVKAVEDGTVGFFPERWTRVYLEWMAGLRDWNVSRQLWLGHRVPVYYCANGHTFASVDEPAGCPEGGDQKLRQDPPLLHPSSSPPPCPSAALAC